MSHLICFILVVILVQLFHLGSKKIIIFMKRICIANTVRYFNILLTVISLIFKNNKFYSKFAYICCLYTESQPRLMMTLIMQIGL